MKKKDVLTFLGILLLTIFMCFPYMTMHYSTDTYTIIGDGYEKYAIETFLNAGRVFSSIITWSAGYFEIPINIFVQLLFFIGIIISCVCVMEIRKIILSLRPVKNIFEEILVVLISYSIIFQFMYLENMYFVEMPIMAIGILFFIKAADKMVNQFYMKSMLYLLMGVLCYQGTINFFITFTFLLLIIQYNKLNQDVIRKIIVASILCIIAIGINILQIKLCGMIWEMEQNRLGGITQIPNNITYIFNHIGVILVQSSDLLPNYTFLTFLNTILILSIFAQIQLKEQEVFMPILLLIIVAILSSIAINVISLSSFGLGRMVFSVGALIGLIFMYLYCATNVLEKKGIIQYILLTILVLYVIMNILNYSILMYKNQQTNQLDKLEAERVNGYITQYEKQNNIKVEKIAVSYDKNITWYYKQLNHESLFTHRGLMIWWCNVQAINYYTNRRLEKVDMDSEVYDEYFEGKDWDQLKEEQFVFKGDTLYYCVY